MNKRQSCTCGAADCWPADDYSWLASESGWHGHLHGCHTSVFFIHGRKIREQRHVPSGRWTLAELAQRLQEWTADLPNARLVWDTDTGDGESGLWIEGEREPNEADWQRLHEARARQRRRDEDELARIQRRLAVQA